MNLKSTFLAFCVIGTLLPLSQFIPWLIAHGLNVTLFVQELFSKNIGSFVGMDVIVSAIVLFVFVYSEGKRLNMSRI